MQQQIYQVHDVDELKQCLIGVKCSRILPLSVFCVLQGSGVTPLKCGEREIYDTDFVANFTKNTTVKKF